MSREMNENKEYYASSTISILKIMKNGKTNETNIISIDSRDRSHTQVTEVARHFLHTGTFFLRVDVQSSL